MFIAKEPPATYATAHYAAHAWLRSPGAPASRIAHPAEESDGHARRATVLRVRITQLHGHTLRGERHRQTSDRLNQYVRARLELAASPVRPVVADQDSDDGRRSWTQQSQRIDPQKAEPENYQASHASRDIWYDICEASPVTGRLQSCLRRNVVVFLRDYPCLYRYRVPSRLGRARSIEPSVPAPHHSCDTDKGRLHRIIGIARRGMICIMIWMCNFMLITYGRDIVRMISVL